MDPKGCVSILIQKKDPNQAKVVIIKIDQYSNIIQCDDNEKERDRDENGTS